MSASITAVLCALNDHPPQTTATTSDTKPRPITCGCGARTYMQHGVYRIAASAASSVTPGGRVTIANHATPTDPRPSHLPPPARARRR